MGEILPVQRTCMICENTFLAEWGRVAGGIWHTGDVCWPCEDVVRRNAAGQKQEE